MHMNFSELAYGHAMKKHVAFPTIDKMNKLIHGYYSKSPKRTSFLDNYMKTMGETSFRISPSIQTRYILYFRLVFRTYNDTFCYLFLIDGSQAMQ